MFANGYITSVKKLFLLFFFFCLIVRPAFSQKSLNIDSLEMTHKPGNAALRSALLPGLGQAYNKRYWKIPIIYATIGTLVYFAHYNNTEYQRFSDAYKYRLDGDSTTVDEFSTTNLSATDLKTQKDYWHRNRDLCIIGIGLTYVLNIIDAYVDAHLFYFKISDQLTLHYLPQTDFIARKSYAGVNLQLTF